MKSFDAIEKEVVDELAAMAPAERTKHVQKHEFMFVAEITARICGELYRALLAAEKRIEELERVATEPKS